MLLRNRRLQNVEVDVKNNISSNHLQNYKDANLRQSIMIWTSQNFDPKAISHYLEQINSKNIYEVHQGIIALRKVLCDHKMYLQNVIDSGLITRIIELANEQYYLQLTFEANWILANLSMVDDSQNEFMLRKGLLSVLEKQLSQKYIVIIDQVLWCIANISTSSITNVEMILNTTIPSKIFEIFINLNETNIDTELRKTIIWISKNILSQVDKVNRVIQVFLQMCVEQYSITQDKELKDECLQALGKCFCDENKQFFKKEQFIISLYDDLFQEMNNEGEQNDFLYCILNTIGGLTSLNDSFYVQQFHRNGLIDLMSNAIHFQKEKNLKSVIWIIQNFTLEKNKTIIDKILVSEGLVPKIINLVQSKDKEIKNESLWLICAFCQTHLQSVLIALLQNDFLLHAINIFKEENVNNINLLLEIIIKLFVIAQANQNLDVFKKHLYDKGIHIVLQNLQYHPSDVVYFRALLIIENFLIN